LPGVLIYVVSYQFVSRSIESWFDVKVEGALDAGLNLGRVTLDTLANDLASKTRAAAAQLAETPDASAALALERLREQLPANDLILWSGNGQLIASAGQSRFELTPSGLRRSSSATCARSASSRSSRGSTTRGRPPSTTPASRHWPWCRNRTWACSANRACCRSRR